MHGTYLQNKIAIYNYRATHQDKIKTIKAKYYKKCQEWKRISKIYLNILLD